MRHQARNDTVIALLGQIRQGRPDAEAELLALVLPALRRLAAQYMRRERPDHTLQTTALVHEAYIRLLGSTSIDWQDRSHFYGVDFDNAQITLVETGTPSVLTPAGIAHRTVANLLTGAQLYRFRQRPPLYTVDWTKAGGRGRIFWCDDDETQTVDLSGYSSGTDVLGDPITLSAAYEVGMSPVFCAR